MRRYLIAAQKFMSFDAHDELASIYLEGEVCAARGRASCGYFVCLRMHMGMRVCMPVCTCIQVWLDARVPAFQCRVSCKGGLRCVTFSPYADAATICGSCAIVRCVFASVGLIERAQPRTLCGRVWIVGLALPTGLLCCALHVRCVATLCLCSAGL